MLCEKTLPRLFLVLLLAVMAAAIWQWRHGAPLSANLMELVPEGRPDALELEAERRMQEPLNRELLVLVGSADRQRAIDAAGTLAEHWRGSGLFEKVQWSLQADLPALRSQLLAGRLALLPEAARRQLIEDPQAFIAQRLASLFDPFQGFSLVPSQDDWLGLTGRILADQPFRGNVQPDLASGALIAVADSQHWVLLTARTRTDAFDMSLPLQVASLLHTAREETAPQGVHLLAASGLLYAAEGQRQASREMTWVGGGATLGILALLLLAFRRWRVLLALVAVAVGMLFGTVACVALFGHMHVMTLVLGASLIGVATDYPLHALSKAWSLRPWQAWPAMRLTFKGLTLSLVTSGIGYLALGFTPFPALTQIAVFSAAGLLGAWSCSVCLLPALLGRTQPNPPQAPLRWAQCLLDLRQRLASRGRRTALLALLAVFCLGGLWQLQTRNDMRQWVAAPPDLTRDAQAIARITDYQPTSQFYLLRADDEQQLLQREQALRQRLDPLVADGRLRGYLALSQLVAPVADQRQTKHALAALPAHWQPLLDAGLPEDGLRQEMEEVRALPELRPDDALSGPLGVPWRPLWLGRHAEGVASIISLQGMADTRVLQAQAEGLAGVKLVDRLGELNGLFAATQVSAVKLKLLSCLLIVLVLIPPFGLKGALRIIVLPLLAALCSLASLGWLGQPLTLFSVFGLLLVTAISVDYAIIMRERIGGTAVSLLGTLLAAITTWLSFGLLAVSATPAIANFGLSVSLGLAFSFLLAPWAGTSRQDHRTEAGA